MSRVSNLPQVLSQITHVEKVQQAQQIVGEQEQSRLLQQGQKEASKKKRRVSNLSPAEHAELRIQERNSRRPRDQNQADRKSGDKKSETAEENKRKKHIDIRA